MTNNENERLAMIDEAFAPGMKMIDAFVKMYDLVLDNGLQNDYRYTEASLILLECRNQLQNMCVKRGNELCDTKALIETLQKKPLGRHLIKKAMKEMSQQ